MKIMSLSSLFAIILFSCHQNPLPQTRLEGKFMPNIELQLVDSNSRINTTDIPTGNPIVLFFFSPYCPYCRAEMTSIMSKLRTLRDIRLYLLTHYPYKDMRAFYDHFHLKNHPEIVVALDPQNSFGKYFHVTDLPYIVIYTPQKRLKEIIDGRSDPGLIQKLALE